MGLLTIIPAFWDAEAEGFQVQGPERERKCFIPAPVAEPDHMPSDGTKSLSFRGIMESSRPGQRHPGLLDLGELGKRSMEALGKGPTSGWLRTVRACCDHSQQRQGSPRESGLMR